VGRGEIRALLYQFSFGALMTIDEQIDSLILDYNDYRNKRHKAIVWCDTEYVATLDKRMRQTRDRLDLAMQVKQNEHDLKDHELTQWADGGFRLLTRFGKKPIRLPGDLPPLSRSEASTLTQLGESSRPEYIVPLNPTVEDWRRVALRYAETGSKEYYKLMLSMVRLDHPVPNLWREPEPVKTITKTSKPRTLESLWYNEVREFGWLIAGLLILALVLTIIIG
jgi:hypothetical protein